MPAARRVYYGKVLKRRPLLVALDVFPAFYALARGRQRARDYVREYEAGRLSHSARRLPATRSYSAKPVWVWKPSARIIRSISAFTAER